MPSEQTPPTTPETTPPAPALAKRSDPYDISEPSIPDEPDDLAPPATPSSPGSSLPAKGQAAQPSHPSWLVARAQQHGLDPAEFADLSTDQLKRDVQLLDRQAAAYEREFSRRQAQPAPEKKTAPAPELDDELGLDAAAMEEFDPRLIGALKKVAGKNKKLEEELASYRQVHQEQQRESTRKHLDNLFDEIADDYGHIFGAGDSRKLTNDQMGPRVKAVAAMEGIRNSYRQLKLEIPSDEELRDMAVKGMFGAGQAQEPTPAKPARAAAPKALTQRQEEWSNQGLAVPTARNSELPKGEARAIKAIRSFQKERGVQTDEEIRNGLPG